MDILVNDIKVSSEQQKLLDEHLRLIIEINKTHNLTRITSWEKGKIYHIEDSILGIQALNSAPAGRYADIGTGGGFPGIPLAILSGRETVLVDSVGKKTKALDSIISSLGLSSYVSTYTGRTEELALSEPESFSAITARALSSLPSLLELAAPLLTIGGYLICYKAQPENKELSQAIALKDKLGLELIQTYNAVLSDDESQRVIFVFKKINQPQISLPRRVGMAQKRPYTA